MASTTSNSYLGFAVGATTTALKFTVYSSGTVVSFNASSELGGSVCVGDNSAFQNSTSKDYYDTITCNFPRTGKNFWVTLSPVNAVAYVAKIVATQVTCGAGLIGDACQFSTIFFRYL